MKNSTNNLAMPTQSPLDLLINLVEDLTLKPFFLFLRERQEDYIEQLIDFIRFSRGYIKEKNLQDTPLNKAVSNLENTLEDRKISEDEEAIILQSILDISYFYSHVDDPTLGKKIKELEEKSKKIYPVARSLQIYLEIAKQKRAELKNEEIKKADLATIMQEGIFYILEYHLQMYYELTHCRTDQERMNLIENTETKVPAGTLMGLRREMDSKEFLDRFAYKIIDEKLHLQLVKIYYQFKETLDNLKGMDNWQIFISSYKEFTVNLLKTFGKEGIDKIKGVVYTPYGSNEEVQNIINQL